MTQTEIDLLSKLGKWLFFTVAFLMVTSDVFMCTNPSVETGRIRGKKKKLNRQTAGHQGQHG